MGYITIDFDNFTENDGLKGIVAAFAKKGAPVLSVDADKNQKPKREAGQLTKKAVFHFEDAQSVTIKVNSHGAVYQVMLNSKKVPVKNTQSISKAVEEICAMLAKNSASFQKALAKKALKAVSAPSRARAATTSIQSQLTSETERSKGLQALVDEKRSEVEKEQKELERLSEEIAKTDNLISEAFVKLQQIGAA